MRPALYGLAGIVAGALIGAGTVAVLMPPGGDTDETVVTAAPMAESQEQVQEEPADAAPQSIPAPPESEVAPGGAPVTRDTEDSGESPRPQHLADVEPLVWEMASAYSSKLPQLGSLGVGVAEKLALISGSRFRLRFHEPNELVAPLQMFDAVAEGRLDAAWSTSSYWIGKNEAFAFFSAVPFGPSAREFLAWIYFGGGLALMDELYGQFGLKAIPCGVTAPEASGWFRQEVNSVTDFKGLELRMTGLAARVVQKLGVSIHLLAGKDVLTALENGKLDGTEFSMPAIDMTLGLHKLASHYYFPGWHQQATLFELLVNEERYQELSATRRAQLRTACGDNVREGLAQGEALQGEALLALQDSGVTIHRWSPEILAVLEEKWFEVAEEISAENPDFARIWESYRDFRSKYGLWDQLGYL